jgi:hypothetical protein
VRAAGDPVEQRRHRLDLCRPADERRPHGPDCHGRPGIAQRPSRF